jgi:hypothetical protein
MIAAAYAVLVFGCVRLTEHWWDTHILWPTLGFTLTAILLWTCWKVVSVALRIFGRVFTTTLPPLLFMAAAMALVGSKDTDAAAAMFVFGLLWALCCTAYRMLRPAV